MMIWMNVSNSRIRNQALISFVKLAAVATAVVSTSPASAGTTTISGTRNNITPGGQFGGRCAPAITVGFAPGGFVAEGTSNLGAFSYTASHCIAAPPPSAYYDGLFEWSFGNGSLTGTYNGELFATETAGLFNIVESILFTGGTGRYAGANGLATGTGTVQFGMFQGTPASFGYALIEGTVAAPGIPEPSSWAMLIVGFGLIGGIARRKRAMPLISSGST